MTAARGRVLHFIPSMGGGGAEKQLALLASSLPNHGWDVEVAVLNRGVHFERLERSGARLHYVESSSRYDPLIPMRLGRVIRAVKPDLVQTWLPQMDVAAGLAAITHRVPWIVSERVTQPLPPSLKRRIRDAVISRATAVISNSEEALHAWRARWPKLPRHYIPNALALHEFEHAEPADLSRYRVTPGSHIVLVAGRLVLQKNMEAFRAAMALVAREVDAVGVICGIGPQRDVLLERIERDELKDRVILAGYVNNLADYMKAADCVVSVSFFEGRSNAVMEAMACGAPLVVSNIPEHREVLHPGSALLVDPYDPHDIAQGILDVLRDPVGARVRAAEARKAVDVWTPDAIAAEYARIYQSLRR